MTVFDTFGNTFKLQPEEITRLKLMEQEGITVKSAGVTYWVDNTHSAARVTNQLVSKDLYPVDDCSDEWEDLMAHLDGFEEANGHCTAAMWFILYDPSTQTESFMAYSY